jgi:hypothetical protein
MNSLSLDFMLLMLLTINDSKLAVIDPLTNEGIKEGKDDQEDYVEVDFESL